jgi:asparagine synthase (glutamine-hydrolysing)
MFQVAGIIPNDKIKKISFLGLQGGLGEYMLNRALFIPSQVARLLDCSEEEVIGTLKMIQHRIPAFVKKLVPEERASYLELNLYMQNQLLKDTDCMSMWHSLEVRVPFLDKQLMELAYSINPDVRYDKNQIKYLLINAFGDELPQEIWKRPKQGFTFPFEQWMKMLQPTHGSVKNVAALKEDLVKGKIHWSRYWAYLLSLKMLFEVPVV